MIKDVVLEFINRRFKKDCDFKSGNCYYFAIILCERFKEYNPVIYYDSLEGHFITEIKDIFYDCTGKLEFNSDYKDMYILKWFDLYNNDQLWGDRIIRDVIL